MATLTQVRGDIATRLSKIPGLNVWPEIEDQIEAPAAVVGMPEDFEYNHTFGPNGVEYSIPVRLYATRIDSGEAQRSLDIYIAPTGDHSVKRAIEDSTVTIDSDWHIVNVPGGGEFGVYQVGGVDYLGVEIVVEVLAE